MSVNIYGSPAGVHIPVATDFRANQTASSRYRYRRVVPDGNQSNLVSQASATQDINFRFGSGYVLNLAKTRLRIFERFSPATSVTAGTRTYVRALPPIRGIRLQTSAGVILFDIQNFDAFMNVVYPFSHKNADIKSEAKTLGGHGYGASDQYDYSTGPYDSAAFANAPLYSSANPFPGSSSLFRSLPRPSGGVADTTACFGGMTPGGPLVFPNQRSRYFASGTVLAGITSVSAASPAVAADGTTAVTDTTPAHKHTSTVTVSATGNINEKSFVFGPLPSCNAFLSPIFESIEKKSGTAVFGHQSYDAEPGLHRQYVCMKHVATAGLGLQWDMPLCKLLPHTVCAALQDLYFGTDLMLTITMASVQSRAFNSSGQSGDGADQIAAVNNATKTASTSDPIVARCYGASDATAGYASAAAISPAETTVGLAAEANTIAVETVQDMLLATQENLDLVNSVKSEIASKGMRLPVQQPFMALEAVSAWTGLPGTEAPVSYSRTIRANVARGASILRFYTGFLLSWAADTANSRVPAKRLCANPRDGVWHQYRANLNAVPVADSAISPWDQYVRQYEVCKDSLLQSYRHWQQASGIVVEDYTSAFDLSKTTPEGGLPLANPIEIQIDWMCGRLVTCPTVENVFIGVMLKYLSISPAGVTLESV